MLTGWPRTDEGMDHDTKSWTAKQCSTAVRSCVPEEVNGGKHTGPSSPCLAGRNNNLFGRPPEDRQKRQTVLSHPVHESFEVLKTSPALLEGLLALEALYQAEEESRSSSDSRFEKKK